MIFLKKKHVIPKQGGGGGGPPPWEKFPLFPVFFFGGASLMDHLRRCFKTAAEYMYGSVAIHVANYEIR